MPFWVSVIRGVPGNSESPWSLWVASATGDSLCRCEGLCQGGVSVFMGFLSWVPLHPLSFWVFRVTTEALSLSLSSWGCFCVMLGAGGGGVLCVRRTLSYYRASLNYGVPVSLLGLFSLETLVICGNSLPFWGYL